MPVYHAPLLQIDPKETRRYAGLMKAKDFDEQMILDACEDGLLLAEPRGIWTLYDYDCKSQTVAAEPPFHIEGEKIGAHLAGCDKVILLSATVGEAIEDEVTARFQRGEYASSVLLDAAATTAVEQIADGMEKAIAPQMAKKSASGSPTASCSCREKASPPSSDCTRSRRGRKNMRPRKDARRARKSTARQEW